jgi:membrane protein
LSALWEATRAILRDFVEDKCPTYAAALAFFGLLSIVPMLLVAVAVLAFLFQDPHEAMVRLEKLLANLLPGAAAGRTAHDMIAQARVEETVATLIATRGLAGIIGVLSLVWASLQIFVNGAPAMNEAFEVNETRSWLRLRLVALALLLGAGSLFLLSLLPSSGPDLVRRLHIPWLGLPERVPWYVDLLFTLIALALNVGMFALIYRVLPNATTSWRSALLGGLIAGVLWEAAKQGFAYYLSLFASYERVYGTLGGVIALILWIYYSAMVLLLGAEVASEHARRTAARGSPLGSHSPESKRAGRVNGQF